MHDVQSKMAATRLKQILTLEEEQNNLFFQIILLALTTSNPKRKHRFWVHPILKKRNTHGTFHHLVQELRLHGDQFQRYFRLSVVQFEELLTIIGPKLKRRARNRVPICEAQRLAICLR